MDLIIQKLNLSFTHGRLKALSMRDSVCASPMLNAEFHTALTLVGV